MTTLPPLSDIQSSSAASDSPLATALNIFFEHSPILANVLVPQVHAISSNASRIDSYSELIDLALTEITKWDSQGQSEFVAGHPRIGESKNLSNLSAKEQGQAGATTVQPTPPEVLARLKHLNALYEAKYPGLIYITFVNGRTRAAIAEEMEDVLAIPHSLSPSEPPISEITPVDVASEAWKYEMSRAVRDVGRIAKSRLKILGVE